MHQTGIAARTRIWLVHMKFRNKPRGAVTGHTHAPGEQQGFFRITRHQQFRGRPPD